VQANDQLYTQTLYSRGEGCRYPLNSRLDGARRQSAVFEKKNVWVQVIDSKKEKIAS
jgi:hypothetical protein